MNQRSSSWQVDFYRLPQQTSLGESQWELVVCDEGDDSVKTQCCLQGEATVDWLVATLAQMMEGGKPQRMRVFRPESLQLLQLAGEKLGISVEGTRRTNLLKKVLRDRGGEERIKVESPPPQPYLRRFGENNGSLRVSMQRKLSIAFQNALFLFVRCQKN